MSQEFLLGLASFECPPVDGAAHYQLAESSEDIEVRLTKQKSALDSYNDCQTCNATRNTLDALKAALFEVLAKNQALKERVVDFEAALNSAEGDIRVLRGEVTCTQETLSTTRA
jgi:hypothetical protein